MAAATIIPMPIEPSPETRLLRLMHLASPTLPVGAFAYSQGLEYAVEAGWVTHAGQAAQWIQGLLSHSMGRFDIPILVRLYDAWENGRQEAFDRWNARLLAGRTTAESQMEERQMGKALLRLLQHLQGRAIDKLTFSDPTYTALFAAAAGNWRIAPVSMCNGFAWAWAENQVAAAVKLVPLGQTQGQQILFDLTGMIPNVVAIALERSDDQIGTSAPLQAMASALHETQHTRLFRS